MALLTVHDVSQILDISVDTVRRWDKKGLIKSVRSQHNYRLFNLDEVTSLKNQLNRESSINKYQILKTNKKSDYSVIELFAGAGGTSLGFENAGLNHVLMVENDKDAIGTLARNFKTPDVIKLADVRGFSFEGYGADIVQAGFPCQAFSYAGKSLGFDDIRGTLFFEFARCIKETKPKIAIGENVRGLERHDNGRTLKTMLNVFEELGYNVRYKILKAQYLDVPQKRERLILLGIRKDLDIPFMFPKEKDYIVSLREAIGDCPQSIGQLYNENKKAVLKLVPPGGYWRDLPDDIQRRYMGGSYFLGGGKTGMARRLAWDEPSLTLTCAPAQKQTERCHPEETRPLSVREYARIQTFPDTWEFTGSMNSQYKQIGNAVPVNLAYHIGRRLIAMLDGRWDEADTIIVE